MVGSYVSRGTRQLNTIMLYCVGNGTTIYGKPQENSCFPAMPLTRQLNSPGLPCWNLLILLRIHARACQRILISFQNALPPAIFRSFSARCRKSLSP